MEIAKCKRMPMIASHKCGARDHVHLLYSATSTLITAHSGKFQVQRYNNALVDHLLQDLFQSQANPRRAVATKALQESTQPQIMECSHSRNLEDLKKDFTRLRNSLALAAYCYSVTVMLL
jgi:hypothetical protein